MKEETKKRIDAIRRGEVPENYVRTEYGVFPDHWRFAELREIAQPITETAGVRIIETVSISAGVGFVNQAEKFGKELSGKQYEKYTVLHQGDFSYNKGNSNLYPQGCIYRLNDREVAAVPNVFESFRIVEGDPDYYEQLFLSGFLNHQLFRKINHGVRDDGLLNLTEKDFYSCVLPVPPIEEQHKIARVLSSCDQVICLHQKVLSEMKQMKRTFLSKLFPNAGNLYPELRFHGFTDTWEQRKLGDLYTERNERGNESLQILSVSIHTGVSDGELDTEDLGKVVHRSADKSTYKHVYTGDLIFNMMRAWQGAIGVAKSEGMISPAYISAVPSEEVYPPFMNYLLRRKDAINQINNLSYGVTDFRKRLYWVSFVRVTCQLPSVEEQQHITEMFEKLDSLITLHQREVELHQNKKKALMQLLLIGHVSVS